MNYYIYIIGNQKPVLYTGVTSNLIKRIWQHKEGVVDGFSKKYNLKKLLYFEVYVDPKEAIYREKQLKHFKREWKLDLIRKFNPKFEDLYSNLLEEDSRLDRE